MNQTPLNFATKNQSLLHYAAMGNSLWIVELLISKGADVNAEDIMH